MGGEVTNDVHVLNPGPTLDELAHAAAQAGHDALVAADNVQIWTQRLEQARKRQVEASNAYYLAMQAEEAKPAEPEQEQERGPTG